MKLIWTKQLSVGNAVIDSDHKNLIALTHGVGRAIGAGDCQVMAQAFEMLEGWLDVHFANEEKIVRAIGSDFVRLKRAQRFSLKELQYLRDDLLSKNGIWSESAARHYTHFLKVWMIEHITKVDMQMKPALQSRDYIFWPGCGEGEANHAAGRAANLYLHHFGVADACCA